MSVEGVSQSKSQNKFSYTNALSSAIIGGAAASEVQRALLPVEVKAALKNAKLGEDKFLQKTKAAAEKTLENLKNNSSDSLLKKNRFKISSPEEVVLNAKKAYPETVKVAKSANKALTKTFVGAACAIFAGKLLLDKINNKSSEKK